MTSVRDYTDFHLCGQCLRLIGSIEVARGLSLPGLPDLLVGQTVRQFQKAVWKIPKVAHLNPPNHQGTNSFIPKGHGCGWGLNKKAFPKTSFGCFAFNLVPQDKWPTVREPLPPRKACREFLKGCWPNPLARGPFNEGTPKTTSTRWGENPPGITGRKKVTGNPPGLIFGPGGRQNKARNQAFRGPGRTKT